MSHMYDKMPKGNENRIHNFLRKNLMEFAPRQNCFACRKQKEGYSRLGVGSETIECSRKQ